MAKLTVYVPDDLLDRARLHFPSANTSQVVQRGLEQLVGAGAAAYERRPAGTEDLLAAARDRLVPAAAAEYEDGYRRALSSLDDTFWDLLDSFASHGFDLRRTIAGWAAGALDLEMAAAPEGACLPAWWGPIVRDLGSLADKSGRVDYCPTDAFVRGYGAALRDAWNSVENPPRSGPAQEGETAEPPPAP